MFDVVKVRCVSSCACDQRSKQHNRGGRHWSELCVSANEREREREIDREEEWSERAIRGARTRVAVNVGSAYFSYVNLSTSFSSDAARTCGC
jgi:hypothetical protein